MHTVAQTGVAQVTLLGRSGARCRQVLEAYRADRDAAADTCLDACSYEAGSERLAAADLVVDATPLGMDPSDSAPFDTNILGAGQTVLDVVYGHGDTATVAGARAMGCAVHDGRGMLVAQAVETVQGIAKATGAFDIPVDLDLFAVMSQAAGFDL